MVIPTEYLGRFASAGAAAMTEALKRREVISKNKQTEKKRSGAWLAAQMSALSERQQLKLLLEQTDPNYKPPKEEEGEFTGIWGCGVPSYA